MKTTRILFLSLSLLVAACAPHSFVSIDGTTLVGTDGKPFLIKGTNLGNWLNPEGYMFGFGRTNSPRMIDDLLCEMVGPDEAAAFWKQFKDNYITEEDTCATGERLCPFLGAGPYPKITPAPGGLMTCAKTSRYLRRGWQSPEPKCPHLRRGWQSPDPQCPHLRQNQLVPAPKCQQGAFTGNGEGATSNSDRLPPTARGDRP